MNPKEQMPSPVSPLEENLARTDFDEKTKNDIRRNMNLSNGLWGDAINIFTAATGYIQIDMFEYIEPLSTYEEYINTTYGKVANMAEFILEHSKQESVDILNNIITSFNADLERIKKEKDAKAVRVFFKEADTFIRGEGYDRRSLAD